MFVPRDTAIWLTGVREVGFVASGHIGDVFRGVLHIDGRGTAQSMSIYVVLWWSLVVDVSIMHFGQEHRCPRIYTCS